MKVQLLVNASASSVTARAQVVIQKAISADHDVKVTETGRRGHATRLAKAAVADQMDAVVVLGGDGTLNEAVNGLAGSGIALGVLPGGSTNVFARTLGITNDPIEATGDLLQAMAKDSTRTIGLGNVNGRYFLFHVGMGFDAAVVAQVEKKSLLKRYVGHPLFVYSAFQTWLHHYDRTGSKFQVTYPDGTRITDGFWAIVLETNPYTFLGNRPLNLAPAATLERGFSVVVVRTLKLGSLFTLGFSALGSGKYLRKHRRVDYRDDLKSFDVEGFGPFPYQVDGDYLGETESLHFRHEPDALLLYVP